MLNPTSVEVKFGWLDVVVVVVTVTMSLNRPHNPLKLDKWGGYSTQIAKKQLDTPAFRPHNDTSC